jgi:AAA domain
MKTSHTNTLKYWFDVEALTYPEIPKPGKKKQWTLLYNESLPWQTGLRALTVNHKYFAYFGLVQQSVLEAELIELFSIVEQAESFDGNQKREPKGNTFLCAIEISGDGTPNAKSLQLAAFAVAFAERKNDKIFGYGAVLTSLQTKIANLATDAASKCADQTWFETVTDLLIEELDWRPRELMSRQQLCVHQVPLVNKDGKPFRTVPEIDPINSFYLDDLSRIVSDSERNVQSPQVSAYLDANSGTHDRVDVTQPEAIDTALKANLFPVGRWPSAFPLFMMQQVAVNTAISSLKNGGVFSVNGPPGTGKTTLLMDIVAASIVERATVLATFERPTDAFTRSTSKDKIDYPANKDGKSVSGNHHIIDKRLYDFGIVVTSANNSAVENITHDLPNAEKVAAELLMFDGQPFDYFALTAESVLSQKGNVKSRQNSETDELSDSLSNTEADEDDVERESIKCWGLISAALGNKTNRSKVTEALGHFGLNGILKLVGALDSTAFDWVAAKDRLATAVQRVNAIQKQINEHDELLSRLAQCKLDLDIADTQLVVAQQSEAFAKASVGESQVALDAIEAQYKDNLREREQLGRDWPWWRQLIELLMRRVDHQEFQRHRRELESDFVVIRENRKRLQLVASDATRDCLLAQTAVRQCTEVRVTCVASFDRVESRKKHLELDLGAAAFNPTKFQQRSTDEQQKSLPRTNAKYQTARAEVFIAALHLHKCFIKNAGKVFETNFRLALSMLQGEQHVQRHLPFIAKDLWATFFLVVPVVSSTFASFSRCFRDFGSGEIGLLLIDEAGQAVPSHALGAIWRSKRALIVGDPMQVEPVIKIDKKLDDQIRRYHNAPDQHLLTKHSAQHLADSANRYGSIVRQYDGSDLWVGSPLRVHRRCVDPMFSLSNAIAYNGKMVFGPDRDEEVKATDVRPLMGSSRWIDVNTGEFDEHFNENEAKIALDIAIRYAEGGWVDRRTKLPDLFVISPFKSMADGITELLRDQASKWARDFDDEILSKWLHSHVGTVHRFQGKECESVIFVLGGKTPGARQWAASAPNIINVAATRAKRRLYVIGNRVNWSQTTFGTQLADKVRTHANSG